WVVRHLYQIVACHGNNGNVSFRVMSSAVLRESERRALEYKGVKVVEKFDKVTYGQRLRRERIDRSFSQEEVAEEIGTTAANVSRWELGYTFPTPYYRRK